MIASLKGIITEKHLNRVIIECAGVGYGVFITLADSEKLQPSHEAKLFIFENIKEDAHDMFGFLGQDSKHLFEQLLSVKNVGPKVAMSVLDIGPSNVVRLAISNGDVKQLQTAKGVGKRAAEQMVVELRDKVGAVVGEAAEDIVTRGGADMNDEALQALLALGYSEADAAIALKNVDKTLPTEERIKQALKSNF
jgi:Holliday junction DNA helicase RuvA